jgi:ProP effector
VSEIPPGEGQHEADNDWHAIATAGLVSLTEQFPKAFSVYEGRRRPLKVGVHLDIVSRLNGVMTPQEVGITLRLYTSANAYLRACRAGADRIDLDGNPLGTVSESDAENAQARLQAKKHRKAKPKAKSGEPAKKRLGLVGLRLAAQARKQAGAA